MTITEKKLGVETSSGEELVEICLSNGNIDISVINYGCIITKILVPDRDGVKDDIVFGFDDYKKYLGDHPYFGAAIGRCAGRVKKGRFSIDNIEYQLSLSGSGKNHLHGGYSGHSFKTWSFKTQEEEDFLAVTFHLKDYDNKDGYPGNLEVWYTIKLTKDNRLYLNFEATTDAPTIVNLTNHNYYNLGGHKRCIPINNQYLQLNSSYFLDIDNESIPTGALVPVKDTPFDFQNLNSIGNTSGINKNIDYTYVLEKDKKKDIKATQFAAKLYDYQSGRVMDIYTNLPSVQLYNACAMSEIEGKYGVLYLPYSAICLETQMFPDSSNHSSFKELGSHTILKPGERYNSTTCHHFYSD